MPTRDPYANLLDVRDGLRHRERIVLQSLLQCSYVGLRTTAGPHRARTVSKPVVSSLSDGIESRAPV